MAYTVAALLQAFVLDGRLPAGARGRSGCPVASAAAAALQQDYERYVAAVQTPLRLVPESVAQRTQAVRVRQLLSQADIADVHRVAAALAQRPGSSIDRSAWGQPAGTWQVTFLNADGTLEAQLPEVYGRVRDAALAVDRRYWNATAGIEYVNYRVAEFHTMRSTLDGRPTGGGLHTKRHCDHGSLLTIDIMLTNPAEIEGGVLQTLEPDGTMLSHDWEQGDALVFLSHKYHSVSELRRGLRNVLVCEFWQGGENLQPSRDEQERWRGALRDDLRAQTW